MDPGDKVEAAVRAGRQGGDRLSEGSVGMSKTVMLQKFAWMRRCRVAMEVGTQSAWVSQLLSRLGFEVIVANARQVQLISASSRKKDRMDARLLARLARVDPQLLRPIRHRSEKASASRPDDDPGPRGTDGDANSVGECGARLRRKRWASGCPLATLTRWVRKRWKRGPSTCASACGAAIGAGRIADGSDQEAGYDF